MRRVLPAALALLAFAGLVAARTPGTSIPGEPAGSDWAQYLAGAHALLARGRDPELASAWPDWRHALYPMSLGLLSLWLPAVTAARLLAAAGMLGAGIGTWLLARVLGGRAAPWAALSLLASSVLLPWATGWMNPYPLLAGFLTLSLGLAAWSSRAGSAPAAAGAGLCAGIAWGLDPRGALALIAVALAVLVSAPRARSAWLPGVALVCGLALGPALDRVAAPRTHVGQEASALARLPLDRQIAEQRSRTLEELQARGPAELAERCAPARASDDCGRGLLALNLQRRRDDRDLPPLLLLPLALFALLPRARTLDGHRPRVLEGWRSSLLGLLLLAIPLGAVVWGASRVLFPDRYLLPFLPALAVAMTVGAARLAEALCARTSPRLRAGAHLAALLGLVASAWGTADAHRPREGVSATAAAAWAWTRAHVPASDGIMDCAGLGFEARALPERLHPGRVNPSGIDGHACLAWAREPWSGGPAWILTSSAGPLPAPGKGWASVEVFATDRLPAEPPVTLWRRLRTAP